MIVVISYEITKYQFHELFYNLLEKKTASSYNNLKRYPTKFLEMCQSSVLNDKELEVDFRLLIASVSSVEGDSNSEVVDGLFKALVSKLENTRMMNS